MKTEKELREFINKLPLKKEGCLYYRCPDCFFHNGNLDDNKTQTFHCLLSSFDESSESATYKRLIKKFPSYLLIKDKIE